jgi:hypothetical protein
MSAAYVSNVFGRNMCGAGPGSGYSNPQEEEYLRIKQKNEILQQKSAFQTRREAREDLASIKARHGVYPEMRRHTQADEVEFTQLEKLKLEETAASLNIFRQELAKYPQAFLTFYGRRRKSPQRVH